MEWKKTVTKEAMKHGSVRSLLGRHRNLPHLNHPDKKHQGHSKRAAINYIVQGSAADIVMLSMLELRYLVLAPNLSE